MLHFRHCRQPAFQPLRHYFHYFRYAIDAAYFICRCRHADAAMLLMPDAEMPFSPLLRQMLPLPPPLIS
jgi:hypothetical protein